MAKQVVRLTESELYGIVNDAVKRIILREDDVRYDKYGGEIKRGGQGWGIDPSMRNRQGYEKNGKPSAWFSRSVAVATAVLLNDNGQWYILANERGSGTPDYHGYWNLPCGYLDYNETAEEAAMREVYEETGIRCQNIKNVGHSTSPNENRQNVCFFFVSFLEGSVDDYPFSKDNMEKDEVGGIRWVPVEDAVNVKWAFDHDGIIERILAKYANKMSPNSTTYSNVGGMVDKAIELVRSGGDEEYLLLLLQKIRQSL